MLLATVEVGGDDAHRQGEVFEVAVGEVLLQQAEEVGGTEDASALGREARHLHKSRV